MTVATAPASWYVVRGGADIYWRAELPAKHIGAKMFVLREEDANPAFTQPNEDGPFPWSLTEDGAVYPQHEGTAVWTRPCMVRATHAAAMTANGVRCVAEVDDNYLSNPRQNIFMRINGYSPEQQRKHMAAMASMDGLIFSTRWLRDQYMKALKAEGKQRRVKHLPEAFVCRNSVDEDDPRWREPERRDRVRVGWMGSQQHVWDIRLAFPALEFAYRQGAEIVYIGLDPGNPEHGGDPKWREYIPEYTHIPWVDFTEYHSTQLPIDIGLCPLLRNEHTLGKSDVKFLEYTMAGAVTVASNNEVYNRSIRHGDTGFLCGSPEEFAAHVALLMADEERRLEVARSAQQYVREERTIQREKENWLEAIRGRD